MYAHETIGVYGGKTSRCRSQHTGVVSICSDQFGSGSQLKRNFRARTAQTSPRGKSAYVEMEPMRRPIDATLELVVCFKSNANACHGTKVGGGERRRKDALSVILFKSMKFEKH